MNYFAFFLAGIAKFNACLHCLAMGCVTTILCWKHKIVVTHNAYLVTLPLCIVILKTCMWTQSGCKIRYIGYKRLQ